MSHTLLQWNQTGDDSGTDREPLPATPFRLGAFRVDPTSLTISNGMRTTRVERKVMEVLLCLAHTPTETVTRETLLKEAWQGAFVSDGVLHRVVSILRSALSDDARNPRYVETVPRVGYRLLESVEWETPPERATGAVVKRPPRIWLLAAGALAGVVTAGLAWSLLRVAPGAIEVAVHPLTSEQGWEIEPAISPDGRWLAYVQFGDDAEQPGLYLSQAEGGSSRRLLAGQKDGLSPRAPAWSSDATEIAWIESGGEGSAAEGSCSIRIQPLIADEPTRSIACSSVSGLDWSPDGRDLVFDDVNADGRSGLRVVDLQSMEGRWLTSQPEGTRDLRPRYSPDGSHIVVAREETALRNLLVVLDQQGHELVSHEAEEGFVAAADWLSDDELVVSVQSGFFVGSLWLFSWQEGTFRRIPDSQFAQSPAVAGDAVVHSRDSVQSGIWSFSQSEQERPSVQIGSTQVDVHPGVSPDGLSVAFASDRSGSPQIWLASPDGEEQLLTALEVGWLGPPRWNSDGSQLLFESKTVDGYSVHRLDISTGTSSVVAIPFDVHREPTWGPEGRIVVASPAQGLWQLWKQETDGEWTQLTQDGGLVSAMSPDGNWIYYTKYDQAGLWRSVSGARDEELVLDWLSYNDRRNWAVTARGVVAVRVEGDYQRALVHVTPEGAREITTVGEALVMGVSAGGDRVSYGMLEFTGSDIYVARIEP